MLVTVRVGSALEDAGVRAGMFILSARGQSHGDEGSRHGGLRAHLGQEGREVFISDMAAQRLHVQADVAKRAAFDARTDPLPTPIHGYQTPRNLTAPT